MDEIEKLSVDEVECYNGGEYELEIAEDLSLTESGAESQRRLVKCFLRVGSEVRDRFLDAIGALAMRGIQAEVLETMFAANQKQLATFI